MGGQAEWQDYYCQAGSPFRLYNSCQKRDTDAILCQPDGWDGWHAPIYQPPPVHDAKLRIKRAEYPPEDLILDNSQQHSAKELCESPTSFGPDFVNLEEGLFCRMADKKLWPLCRPGWIHDCFSVKSRALNTSSEVLSSPYREVLDWRRDKSKGENYLA